MSLLSSVNEASSGNSFFSAAGSGGGGGDLYSNDNAVVLGSWAGASGFNADIPYSNFAGVGMYNIALSYTVLPNASSPGSNDGATVILTGNGSREPFYLGGAPSLPFSFSTSGITNGIAGLLPITDPSSTQISFQLAAGPLSTGTYNVEMANLVVQKIA